MARANPLLPLAGEAVKFGLVGGLGFVTDVGIFNLLQYAGDPGLLHDKPLTAKVISVLVATCVTYLGNRHWTWGDRPRGRTHRDVVLFFFFNGVGMAIALACLGIGVYVLGFESPLARNIAANVFGTIFGMVFRFWSYRTFVFPREQARSAASSSSPLAR